MRDMKNTILNLVVILAVATTLFTVAGAAQASARDFTGLWSNSNDGTPWYITQHGSTVWFYGEEKDSNPSWATVGRGTIRGNYIVGDYSTVPKGSTVESNSWKIKIVSDNELKIREGAVLIR